MSYRARWQRVFDFATPSQQHGSTSRLQMPEAMDAVAVNMRHIVLHAAKPQPLGLPETAVTRGFEAAAYPVLVSQLRSDAALIRRKALLAARELLVVDTRHVQCITAGITPPLLAALEDPDAQHRAAAAGTLQLLVCRELGARDFLQHGGLDRLLPLLTDADSHVRDAAYGALAAGCAFDCCRAAMARQDGALPLLLDRALSETPGRTAAALALLNTCLQMRHAGEALSQLQSKEHCIADVSSLLDRADQPQVWQQAAALLAVLAATDDGVKEQAVEQGCVAKLLQVLTVEHCSTAGNIPRCVSAACALMMILLIKPGKQQTFKDQGVAVLASALSVVRDEALAVALLQCVANVAELQLGRNALLAAGVGAMLEGIAAEGSERVVSAAKRALRGVRFEHWPQ